MAASLRSGGENPVPESSESSSSSPSWAQKYRGATVEDLDPPPALSIKPTDLISAALMNAYERDYTHLTVVSADTRALLGYLSIPRLKERLKDGSVKESDRVGKVMQKFLRRKGNVYKVITMDTPLEELEAFFVGGIGGGGGGGGGGGSGNSNSNTLVGNGNGNGPQDFAVVTDWSRKFVLGVATKADLEEFVKRRPA